MRQQLFAIVKRQWSVYPVSNEDTTISLEVPIGAIVEVELSKCAGEGTGLSNFILAPKDGWVPILYDKQLRLIMKGFLDEFWLV